MRTRLDARIRYLAAAAAAVVAGLYVLIGFEVIFIGEATSTNQTELLPFGLMAGGAFALIAVLLALFARRLVWIPVALFTLVVIVAYFPAAELREPPFAAWGLVVKSVQVLLLGALAYLVVRGSAAQSRPGRSATEPGTATS